MDVPGIFGAPFRTWLLRRIKLVLKVRGGLTMLSGGHEVICDHHFLCITNSKRATDGDGSEGGDKSRTEIVASDGVK